VEGQKIWTNILSELKKRVSSSTLKTWFGGSYVLDFKEGEGKRTLIVAVKNSFLKNQIETRYFGEIEKIGNSNAGIPIEVIFVVSQKETKETTKNVPIFSGIAQSVVSRDKNTETFNLNFTFENFVVGPSNNIAFLAAKQVASQIGSIYNPLLLYGPTGVGKTHLLQAIGRAVISSTIDAKVLYVSCEKFTNDYIGSLKNKAQEEFRRRYRGVDLLLIDDIQFLAGKESTQDEFFYTFNDLVMAGKQVVIVSDRHPKKLGKLKDRLISRFLGGMVADVGTPDFEMRVAILKNKCSGKGLVVNDEVISYIAQACSGGARELEGVLTLVLAATRFGSSSVGLSEVKRIIGEGSSSFTTEATEEIITKAVCSHFKLRPMDLASASRKSRLVFARQILMYLLRKDIGMPLEQIGQVVGGRDHSTVIHGVEKVENAILANRTLSDEILRVRSLFRQ